MEAKNTYVVKNMSGTPIFWWVRAWSSPVIADENSSQSYEYDGGFADGYFQVIDNTNKDRILAYVKFPNAGPVIVTVRGQNDYTVTPG